MNRGARPTLAVLAELQVALVDLLRPQHAQQRAHGRLVARLGGGVERAVAGHVGHRRQAWGGRVWDVYGACGMNTRSRASALLAAPRWQPIALQAVAHPRRQGPRPLPPGAPVKAAPPPPSRQPLRRRLPPSRQPSAPGGASPHQGRSPKSAPPPARPPPPPRQRWSARVARRGRARAAFWPRPTRSGPGCPRRRRRLRLGGVVVWGREGR